VTSSGVVPFPSPQLLRLMGPDIRTAWWSLAFVAAQMALAWCVRDLHWTLMVVVAASLGGLLAQSLTLAMHELSHNLAFRQPILNKALGIFVNLPMGLPAFG